MDASLSVLFSGKAMRCLACLDALHDVTPDTTIVSADILVGFHVFKPVEVPLSADITKARLQPICAPLLPWAQVQSYVVDLRLVTQALDDAGLQEEMIQIDANTVGQFLDQIAADW